jgi:hypothetical protein
MIVEESVYKRLLFSVTDLTKMYIEKLLKNKVLQP